MVAAQAFHQRTPLLELAERGRMEPHVLRLRIDFFPEYADGFALATPHLTNFFVEKARNGNAELV